MIVGPDELDADRFRRQADGGAEALAGNRQPPQTTDVMAVGRRLAGDAAEAARLARRASAIAHAAGLREAEIFSLMNLAAALELGGASDAALIPVEQAQELAEDAGHVRLDRKARTLAEAIRESRGAAPSR